MDLLFIFIFILLPLITIVLLEFTGFSLTRVGLIEFVMISLFFFSFLGTLPLYFGWDEYRVSLGVTDHALVFQVMLFSGFTMLNVLFGAVVSKTILSRDIVPNYFEPPVINAKEVWFLLFLFIIVFIVLLIYLSQISQIALFVALFGNADEVGAARSMMGNDFSGKYHWYSLVITHLAHIVTCSFFAIYLTASKKVYLLLFIISFLLCSFSALMTTEKATFGWLLISLFLVYTLVSCNGKYKIKSIFLFTISLLIVLAFSFYIFMGVTEIDKAFLSIFSRVFAGSIQPAYHYLEFFPHYNSFLLGSSLPNPGGVFPFEPYILTQELFDWVFPSDRESGIVGSMPTVFWGEAYANFGWVGIVIVPFLTGFLIYLVDFIVQKFTDTPLKIGFYIWLLIHFKDLSITGFSSYLFDMYLIVLSFLFIVVISVSNNIKIKFKK